MLVASWSHWPLDVGALRQDSQNFNRYISVATDGTPQQVNVCFGGCMPCDELPTCGTEQFTSHFGCEASTSIAARALP